MFSDQSTCAFYYLPSIMGTQLFDQYTYLHFAVGIVAYFWNISLLNWITLHTVFELLENTHTGVNIIQRYILLWPGGKIKPDSGVNMLGDTIGGIIGWLSAYYLDKLGNKYNWYDLHIN